MIDKEKNIRLYTEKLIDEYLRLMGNSLTGLLHKVFPPSEARSMVHGILEEGRIYIYMEREKESLEDVALNLKYQFNGKQNKYEIGYGKISPNRESHIFLNEIFLTNLPPVYSNLTHNLKAVLGESGIKVT